MPGEVALRHVTQRQADALAVVACGLSRHQRAYVSDGLGRRASSRFIDSYEELDRALATLARCDAFVLAVEDMRGRNALETVKRLTREWPQAAIVIFCPPKSERPLFLPALTLAGVRGIVFEGVNDTAATLALAVENARRETVAANVFDVLVPLIPASLQPMVHQVLARPHELTTVDAVASSLGVHRKTLVNRCSKAGFPAPGEVINWCRLAMVAEMLERTGQTIESIALTLGFPSHTALRNQVKRYTRLTATELREGGGLEAFVAIMRRRLGLPIQ